MTSWLPALLALIVLALLVAASACGGTTTGTAASVAPPPLPVRASTDRRTLVAESRGRTATLRVDPKLGCWGDPALSSIELVADHSCSSTLYTGRLRARVLSSGFPVPNELAYF